MNDREKKRLARGGLNGLLLGALLFFGGLFVTIYTWGFGGVIGVPMMLGGLVVPFWVTRKAQHGENWSGSRSRGSAVKSADELRHEVDRLHPESRTHRRHTLHAHQV